MYLRNTSNEVKSLIEKVNELNNENKMKNLNERVVTESGGTSKDTD